jgi:serine/threonine protein kinase
MADDNRLLDLVVSWEARREAGESVDIEELCRDCPELVPALRERLQALGAMNAALADDWTLVTDDVGDTEVPVERLPELPGYEVLRELGRGGMGVVYQARQLGLNRLVALKVLLGGRHASDSSRARFKAEIESIARLQHPNLIQVFEVGDHEGHTFFSMEYVGGGNLEERIAARPLAARDAAELVALLARAMQAAHERDVIHRDLKPANVLLAAFFGREEEWGVRGLGIPKITDFGLAKRMDVSSSETRTEQIMGTPSYMAPEQAKGQSRHVGPATDVYALGAMLYRLLTGRPPFLAEAAIETVRQVAEDEPVPPRQVQPTVPVELETICLKCLQKQPAQRYESAAALADDLRRFLTNEPILAKPIPWWRRLAKWSRRRPAAASLIGLSGFTVVAFLAVAFWIDWRLSRELKNTRRAQEATLATQAKLESALARQVADGLDADFRLLEAVSQSMAALLSQREHDDEAELEGWAKTLVKQEKRIFGIGIAFEPHRLIGKRLSEHYCLYVHEIPGGVSTKQLVPPSYPLPLYLDRDWYKNVQRTGKPFWSEPFEGQRANDTPMLTYSVPIRRGNKFVGVVMADLSMTYFREIHDRLTKQYFGTETSSFVISSGGTFLYHSNPQYEFPAAESSLDRIHATPGFLRLIERMRNEPAGRARATDFASGEPATFYFARIAAIGADFVLVQPEPAEDDHLSDLNDR